MNIKSKAKYPAGALSNFSPYRFTFDGVLCHSMEGVLQAFKFSNKDMQKVVCTLVGLEAKSKGSKKNWKRTQTLYWQGKSFKRDSKDYQKLLDRAYNALAKNTKFQKALLATNKATLKHTLGRKNKKDTVLTQQEFCSRLTRLREVLYND